MRDVTFGLAVLVHEIERRCPLVPALGEVWLQRHDLIVDRQGTMIICGAERSRTGRHQPIDPVIGRVPPYLPNPGFDGLRGVRRLRGFEIGEQPVELRVGLIGSNRVAGKNDPDQKQTCEEFSNRPHLVIMAAQTGFTSPTWVNPGDATRHRVEHLVEAYARDRRLRGFVVISPQQSCEAKGAAMTVSDTRLQATMRVLRPADGVLAFYDGRIAGRRIHSDSPNWLDDGAYTLGVCSYVLVDGAEALVFDTHISLDHAAVIRRTLANAGITNIRVVLSHWHDDHVAGNAVFADCDIIANALTTERLFEHRDKIENGTPPIRPLIMPNQVFSGDLELRVGTTEVVLRCVDVHSEDGTVMMLPDRGLLFAGDTLEDPVTYVAEPDRLTAHLNGLDRLASWDIRRILPNHGAAEVIESGGYKPEIIATTRRYVEKLLLCRTQPQTAAASLADFLGEDATSGVIHLFPPYEAVHRNNVAAVMASFARR